MFSSLEQIIKWVGEITQTPTSTTIPRVEASFRPDVFCLVERTGGELDYPHDTPEFTVSVYGKTDDIAEKYAMNLAIAIKTIPPTSDYHINGVIGAPHIYHLSKDEWEFDVWCISFSLNINLLDKE